MSLDIYLKETVHEQNITHNLVPMAKEAGIYDILWRPEENYIWYAEQLIDPLTRAIANMEKYPKRFKAFDSGNEWGTYHDFLPWLRDLLEACKNHPEAKVEASR